MDQCFRIAVWMFFLIGYLRAAPVTSSASSDCHMNMDDLSFDDLEGVNCKTVTFTYPTNVKTECFAAALMHFEKGFADASEKCDSSQFAIGQTKETLNGLTRKQCMPQATCNFNQTVHGEFADFVTAAKTFVEDFNTYQQLKKRHQYLSMDDLNIDSLQARLRCPNDSKFYTPSKVEGNCIIAALECFMTELNGTVKEECKDPEKNIRQTVEVLDIAIRGRSRNMNGAAVTNSAECPCERWPTANITNFLNAIEFLIQQMNNSED